MLFYLLAFLVSALDQLLKQIVHQNMYLSQSIPVVGKYVALTYVRNTGAAFSLFVGFSSYLMVIGFLVSAVVIYFHYRVPKSDFFTQSALAFIFGGSLGNLLDRFLRSYVIDYIDFRCWPVFNLADIMINAGAAMIVLKLMREARRNAC